MKHLWDGLFKKNPVFVLALGLVPAVAAATTGLNGLSLGLITAVVLLAASIINYVLLPRVPANAQLAVRGLVLIVLVAAAYGLLLRLNPALAAGLGIFVPLVAVTDLLREGESTRQNFSAAILGALGQGLGFALALVVIGVIREFLAQGSIFGTELLSGSLAPLALAGGVPGGLILVGLLLALVNTVRGGAVND